MISETIKKIKVAHPPLAQPHFSKKQREYKSIIAKNDHAKLSCLSMRDIAKLDKLILYLQVRQNDYVDVYAFCKKEWGDNTLLYIFFAEYLRSNKFTSVMDRGEDYKYPWKHIITNKGMELKSIKEKYSNCICL
jgi:hypothetical protein